MQAVATLSVLVQRAGAADRTVDDRRTARMALLLGDAPDDDLWELRVGVAMELERSALRLAIHAHQDAARAAAAGGDSSERTVQLHAAGRQRQLLAACRAEL